MANKYLLLYAEESSRESNMGKLIFLAPTIEFHLCSEA